MAVLLSNQSSADVITGRWFVKKRDDSPMDLLMDALRHPAVPPIEDAKVLFQRAAHLGRSNRFAEELATYEEVVRRFAEANDVVLLQQVAIALVNKGVRL